MPPNWGAGMSIGVSEARCMWTTVLAYGFIGFITFAAGGLAFVVDIRRSGSRFGARPVEILRGSGHAELLLLLIAKP
jgi:hypothetical protein